MNNRLLRVALGGLATWLTIMACTIGAAGPPATDTAAPSQEELAATAAAMVLTAQAPAPETSTPEAVDAAEPAATECQPSVTANLNANVRSGPSTDDGAVGALMNGDSAAVLGRNEDSTWWYIDYEGSEAWIAASVVTSSCIPTDLTVVAAAAASVAEGETGDEEAAPAEEAGEEPVAEPKPDLVIRDFFIDPETPTAHEPVRVNVEVYNQGEAVAPSFMAYWYGLSSYSEPSCHWHLIGSMPPGGHTSLQCDFTFKSWYPATQSSLAIVDPEDEVDESDEGNNEATISPFGVVRP
jgi:uncharacterized protein YraI